MEEHTTSFIPMPVFPQEKKGVSTLKLFMPGHICTLLAYTTILCCVNTVKKGGAVPPPPFGGNTVSAMTNTRKLSNDV